MVPFEIISSHPSGRPVHKMLLSFWDSESVLCIEVRSRRVLRVSNILCDDVAAPLFITADNSDVAFFEVPYLNVRCSVKAGVCDALRSFGIAVNRR